MYYDVLTAFLVCSVFVICLLFIPSSLSASKGIVVESGEAVSPKDLDTNKSVYNNSDNNNTFVVPYLNPLGEEEYSELKERASLAGEECDHIRATVA
jgi:hypothetical protein